MDGLGQCALLPLAPTLSPPGRGWTGAAGTGEGPSNTMFKRLDRHS
jgi:hypothetical protein